MLMRSGKGGNEYSPNFVIRLMIIFFITVAALKLHQFSIYAVGALLVYTLLQKRVEYTYLMLVLLSALSVINPVLVEKGFNFYLVTRGSLFILAVAMTLRAGFQKSAWFMTPFYFLYGYMFYIMLTSLTGWAPLISELKVLLFLVFLGALVQSVAAVNQSGVNIGKIRAGMVVVAIFYIIGSVAVIPFPQIGKSMVYAKMGLEGPASPVNEILGLFNGLTWHSQTLGPLVALLNAFLLSDYLCNFKKRNWLYQALLVSIPILVYKTSSRTALLAYLISLLVTIYFFMQERYVSQAKKNRVISATFLVILVVITVFVLRPGANEQLEAFLRKSGNDGRTGGSVSLTEDLTRTRMGLIEQGLENFRQRPMFGNGFQVSEEMQFIDKKETGMILSAPVEKGVLPVMILEEGGVFGAAIFLAFIIAVYMKYMRLKFSCFLSTFTTFIALNTGEAIFFSTSGSGGILWMICFCALLMDTSRQRRILQEMQLPGVPGGHAAYGAH